MHDLHCRKIVVSLVLVLSCVLMSQAQINSKGSYNFRDFQNKPYYFGMTAALNNTTFKVDHSKNFNTKATYRVAEASSLTGISLNLIANLKLGQFFDFRLLPGFSFSERELVYLKIDSDTQFKESREAVFFEIPIHVRYKSQPYKDKRLFVVGGIKYGYDVTANNKTEKAVVRFSPHEFHAEVGMGVQFFFPYFIFSPEIKFSRGIGNTMIYDQELERSSILKGLSSQLISLSFHIEG